MSVWNEIRKRGTGAEIKKEDEVQEENLWSFAEGIGNVATGMNSHAEGMYSHAEGISKQIDLLKKQQVQLIGKLSDLRRELDAFRWSKKKYTKCNYKI